MLEDKSSHSLYNSWYDKQVQFANFFDLLAHLPANPYIPLRVYINTTADGIDVIVDAGWGLWKDDLHSHGS